MFIGMPWRLREREEITERKKSLAGLTSNIAEIGGANVERKIGKASVRDAIIGTGVAIDKMLALAGQMPVSTQVAVIPPFHIVPTRFEDPFDFRQRERSPLGFTTRFERLHTHRRIHRQQSLPHRFTETDPQHLDADAYLLGGVRHLDEAAQLVGGAVREIRDRLHETISGGRHAPS